ncbi:hypothetical protein [Saliniramus fredricksonii]|uniref:hypothetical protein n=1 Tax=Saliniramus fredricksonii TaxID=1653334 RepID=UPI001041BD5E|nr:hypothetical protein [Saliniramus fredricksonii]
MQPENVERGGISKIFHGAAMNHHESPRRQREWLCFRHLALDPLRAINFADGRELPHEQGAACIDAAMDGIVSRCK